MPTARNAADAHGFIVHGLWPQFADGRWPSQCSNMPGLRDPGTMLDIMPDPRLVQHEWATHGSCSGLSPEEYFGRVRRAFAIIRIPGRFVAPAQGFSLPPSELKREFAAANPGLDPAAIAVSCGNNYLTGIRFCLSKELRPMACPGIRDCRARSIKVPPVR
jgi:ribonuclease T2